MTETDLAKICLAIAGTTALAVTTEKTKNGQQQDKKVRKRTTMRLCVI